MSAVRRANRLSPKRVPIQLWAINALWAALLIGASLVWPMGQGYDEITHTDMAYAYAHEPFKFYGPGELTLSRAIVNMRREMGGGRITPKDPLASQPVPKRAQRPSFEGLGGNVRDPEGTPNQMIQHPPAAYWIYALVMSIPGVSGLAWDLQVWLLRLVGVVLVLPLPLLAWGAARRLLAADRIPPSDAVHLTLVAAVIPLTMPNLVRDAASVNSDVLLIAACSVLLYLLVRVMTGDLRRAIGVGIAVCLMVSLFTKGFALVLPPIVLASYTLGGLMRRDWRNALIGLSISAIGGLIGGLWWMRNLLVYGQLQVTGFGEDFMSQLLGTRGDGDDGRISDFFAPFLTKFIERVWGGIGLADSLTPGAPIVFGWFALAAASVGAALLVRGRSDATHSRLRAWVLTAAPMLTIAVVARGSLDAWTVKATGPMAAQGRYVYHLLVGVGAVVAAGCARVLRPEVLSRLPLVVLIGGLITQVLSWVAVLENWYGLESRLYSGIRALVRWSPVPGEISLLLVAVLPTVAAVVAMAMLMPRLRVRFSAHKRDNL